MGVLNAEQIKAAARLITKQIDVPEWGGTVLVKMLTAKEKVEFLIAYGEARKANGDRLLPDYQARFCVVGMCDEKGNRLYRDDQVEELVNLPSAAPVIERIFNELDALNKMFGDQAEQQLKNSEPTPSAGGP